MYWAVLLTSFINYAYNFFFPSAFLDSQNQSFYRYIVDEADDKFEILLNRA